MVTNVIEPSIHGSGRVSRGTDSRRRCRSRARGLCAAPGHAREVIAAALLARRGSSRAIAAVRLSARSGRGGRPSALGQAARRHDQDALVVRGEDRLLAVTADLRTFPRDHLEPLVLRIEAEIVGADRHRRGDLDHLLRRRRLRQMLRHGVRIEHAEMGEESQRHLLSRRRRWRPPSAGRTRSAARSSGWPDRRSLRSRACACRPHGLRR